MLLCLSGTMALKFLKPECINIMSFEVRCDHEDVIPDLEYFNVKLTRALGAYLEDRFDHAWLLERPFEGSICIPFQVCWAHGTEPLPSRELEFRVDCSVCNALEWTLKDYCLDRDVDLDEVEEDVRLRVVRV